MIARILLALERQNQRRRLKKLLSRPDVLVESLQSRADLWGRIGRETCDMVIVGQGLFPDNVEKVIGERQGLLEAPALVALLEDDDAETRNRLTKAGCDAVLYTGLPTGELVDALQAILEKHLELSRSSMSFKRLRQQPRLDDFVSNSVIMKEFMDLVHRVVDSKTSLLILGETGVGKERLARAIHHGSGRVGSFVAVNCGALPESLLESELFGHEEGAFTGATRARRGCFELAHRGTIFLDEIGEMPHHLQVRLLRVLQDHEVQRVGGEWPIQVDTRVMAATSRDLEEMVRQVSFRDDLLYRLSVVTLKVPPLRERREDIPDLVDSYVEHFAVETGREVKGVTEEAMQALLRYDWPGNVRELINVVERAILLCRGSSIDVEDLPHTVRLAVDPASLPAAVETRDMDNAVFPKAWFQQPLREAREMLVAQFEKSYLSSLLRDTSGRIDETARRAGITTRALFDKMQRYDLKKEDFKNQNK